jgi:glycosyltransferase involved in cell wall biosynthesis
MSKLIAFIPAYKPPPVLLDVVDALLKMPVFREVYVVDDGSGPEYGPLFRKLADRGVKVCSHFINLGKGAALRTGMNMIACQHPDALGIVTCDADGQHSPEDILSVANAFLKSPEALVIGSRTIPKSAPVRSRFGNTITRHVMRFFTGLNLNDTQSGLRALPLDSMPLLLPLKTNGYDYELDVLVSVHRHQIPIVQCPIEGIYVGENETSHFNPLIDSMRIYFVFLRFSSVSLFTALIDYLVFAAVYFMRPQVLPALILSRSVAASFQFIISQSYVFRNNSRRSSACLKYILVLLALSTASYFGIHSLHVYLGLSPYVGKVVVEGTIFLLSFMLLREFVFASG